jgi:hypothetical protein
MTSMLKNAADVTRHDQPDSRGFLQKPIEIYDIVFCNGHPSFICDGKPEINVISADQIKG